jgi:hypothetical protein
MKGGGGGRERVALYQNMGWGGGGLCLDGGLRTVQVGGNVGLAVLPCPSQTRESDGII